ncbi:putative inorganic carbon transporter subunit DabA, partial [Staphylococcus epidermidis]|uniref:putative inorganic carbon transporter subunit DabA n=1 Tax=Staphylococcus epidermidis TaxID=1282 RepID=UPI0011A6777F
SNQQNVTPPLFIQPIHIPTHTLFIPPQHQTSLHHLHYIYLPPLTTQPQNPFHQLNHLIPKLSYKTNLQRFPSFPNINNTHH